MTSFTEYMKTLTPGQTVELTPGLILYMLLDKAKTLHKDTVVDILHQALAAESAVSKVKALEMCLDLHAKKGGDMKSIVMSGRVACIRHQAEAVNKLLTLADLFND